MKMNKNKIDFFIKENKYIILYSMSAVENKPSPEVIIKYIYCSYTPKQAEHIRKYQQKNPDKIREIQRRYRDKKKAKKLAELQATEDKIAELLGGEPEKLTEIPMGKTPILHKVVDQIELSS
jgi:hypothetical protein